MVNCDLRQGDCLDVMAGFDTGCIDLTVTSPPYDNLRTYNGSLNDWTEAKWKAIIAELFRVTKQGGVVVWVVGDATVKGSETGTSFRQALHAMECGFLLHDTMIWNKGGFSAVGALRTRYAPCSNTCSYSAKGLRRHSTPSRTSPTNMQGPACRAQSGKGTGLCARCQR